MEITGSAAARGPAALFYCHDTFGLGHLRRTMSVVDALRRRRPDITHLVATGSPLAHAFRLPERVDYLKLPTAAKLGTDSYAARSLALPFPELSALRRDILNAAATHLRPELVVVDNVPCGLAGELTPTLRRLRRSERTRLVLGLRDVVDEPGRVRRAWTRDGSYELLDEVYDRILVYGQEDVFDVAGAYGFSPAARAKTRYVGYLRREGAPGGGSARERPLVLVTAGGGEDGFPLLRAALESRLRSARRPATWLVVTGPFLSPREQLELARLASAAAGAEVVEFVRDLPGLIGAADVVVSMGGYNSICEILSARRPAVIVPRVAPRLEQLLRARALERRGLVRVVHPDDLTPGALAAEVDMLLESGPGGGRPVELSGLERAAAELGSLLDAGFPAVAGGVR